jgi:hypothetical protein
MRPISGFRSQSGIRGITLRSGRPTRCYGPPARDVSRESCSVGRASQESWSYRTKSGQPSSVSSIGTRERRVPPWRTGCPLRRASLDRREPRSGRHLVPAGPLSMLVCFSTSMRSGCSAGARRSRTPAPPAIWVTTGTSWHCAIPRATSFNSFNGGGDQGQTSESDDRELRRHQPKSPKEDHS